MALNHNGHRLIKFLIWFWWLVPPLLLVLIAVALFLTFIITACSLIGLIRPFETPYAEFDRQGSLYFLGCSLGWALLVSGGFLFYDLVFELNLNDIIYLYAFFVAYVVGGFGRIAWEEFYFNITYVDRSCGVPQYTRSSGRAEPEPLPPSVSSYRYANWDDEEARR